MSELYLFRRFPLFCGMKHFSVGLFIAFWSLVGVGQNTTDSRQSADYYVQNVLLGENVVVGKVQKTGLTSGLGQFRCDSTTIGVSKGIVLSSGKVDGIFKPNTTTEYTSYGIGARSGDLYKGDADLDALANGKSQDATILEFDFVPTKNTIEFRYVFASEEYNEYVGSEFNDVFGFFLSGPGIEGNVNLAVLPDGQTPITVNSINLRKNPAFYRDNSFEHWVATRPKNYYDKVTLYQLLEFDGLTTVLVAKHEVIPYQVYHIKIAIADVADEFLDSGVFLEAASFSSIKDEEGKYLAELAVSEQNPPDVAALLNGEKSTFTNTEIQKEAERFSVTNIYFETNSTDLNAKGEEQLELLAAHLLKNPNKKCRLVGYTDNVGSQTYNQGLSENRAKAVIAFLSDKGVPMNRLNWSGKSFANPIQDNTTEEGRAQNRRVEISLYE